MCMVLVKNMLKLIPKVLKKYFSFNSGNKFWKISGFLLKNSCGLDQKKNLQFSSISGIFSKKFQLFFPPQICQFGVFKMSKNLSIWYFQIVLDLFILKN